VDQGGDRAAAFYREVFGGEVLQLASAETAELSKLSEGAYRDLNIALANELAMVADVHGVDISEVIKAANSQPYCHLHVPGTGEVVTVSPSIPGSSCRAKGRHRSPRSGAP
jgi:UDP-N-acetyl-D-mannosaminuronate dehydrogenase